MLRCPEDRSPLAWSTPRLIARINAAIDAKTLRNRGGELVTRQIEGGLVRADGAYLYPIVDGIPILLDRRRDAAAQLTSPTSAGSKS